MEMTLLIFLKVADRVQGSADVDVIEGGLHGWTDGWRVGG